MLEDGCEVYEVIRDITPKECDWLLGTIKKGTILYEFKFNTYGCIGSGIAVSAQPNAYPFLEVPYSAIKPKHKDNVCLLK